MELSTKTLSELSGNFSAARTGLDSTFSFENGLLFDHWIKIALRTPTLPVCCTESDTLDQYTAADV